MLWTNGIKIASFFQSLNLFNTLIVVDVAIYPQTGKTVFLLAQSYMLAQQIHILVNPANRGLSPWYELSDNDEGKLYTPEWVFEKKDLKRFK